MTKMWIPNNYNIHQSDDQKNELLDHDIPLMHIFVLLEYSDIPLELTIATDTLAGLQWEEYRVDRSSMAVLGSCYIEIIESTMENKFSYIPAICTMWCCHPLLTLLSQWVLSCLLYSAWYFQQLQHWPYKSKAFQELVPV